MKISVNVRGQLVRMGLQNLKAEIPQIGRRQIRVRMDRMKRRMEAYPPERPGQKYVRTGQMFYSWRIMPSERNGYTLENFATRRGVNYPSFVVGNAYGQGQAWMHRGRWELLRDVVEEELQDLPDAIRTEIVMVARRHGLEAE